MTFVAYDMFNRPIEVGNWIVVPSRKNGIKSKTINLVFGEVVGEDDKFQGNILVQRKTFGQYLLKETRVSSLPHSWRVLRLPFTESDLMMAYFNDFRPLGENHQRVKRYDTGFPAFNPEPTAVTDLLGRTINIGDKVVYKFRKTRLGIGVVKSIAKKSERSIYNPDQVLIIPLMVPEGNERFPPSYEHNVPYNSIVKLPCLTDDITLFMDNISA